MRARSLALEVSVHLHSLKRCILQTPNDNRQSHSILTPTLSVHTEQQILERCQEISEFQAYVSTVNSPLPVGVSFHCKPRCGKLTGLSREQAYAALLSLSTVTLPYNIFSTLPRIWHTP